MNIKRFFGKNSREALSLVRKELGEDAIILSNRAMNGGNEIMAFIEEDMHAVLSGTQTKATLSSNEHESTSFLSHLNKKNNGKNQQLNNDDERGINAAKAAFFVEESEPKKQNSESYAFEKSSYQAPNEQVSNTQMTAMLQEMRQMRSVLESQLTTMSWGNVLQRNPVKSKMLSTLLAAGFSAALSRQLTEKLPADLDATKALIWIKAILAKNLNTIENETEMLDQGGVFALIGPTGVGKTTTTAKLAARFVMKHGTQSLGLITTDAYRIGGHEQLRIYGKILGVMVHAVKDEADLKIALNELSNKHTILIDTVGVSQRDQMVTEQIAMLSNTKTPIKRLLCLSAVSTSETLTDVIRAYRGKNLDGCIMTKLDEAVTIGNALDVIVREKLKLFYTTNGQRVPEDIHLANRQKLIDHATSLKHASNLSFQFLEEELPFVMGNSVYASNAAQLADLHYA
jgi:flagellar biosynthesis protein FlhF